MNDPAAMTLLRELLDLMTDDDQDRQVRVVAAIRLSAWVQKYVNALSRYPFNTDDLPK